MNQTIKKWGIRIVGATAVGGVVIGLGLFTFKLDVPHTSVANIGNPENVQIITADYDAFWQAYDTSKNDDGTLNKQAFAEKYNPNISPRLAEFSGWRYMDKNNVFNNANLADFYNSYRHAYPVATHYKREPIVAGYKKLREYLPDAPLPHVSIFMGQMNNGGTVTSDALIIAHEMEVDFTMADFALHPRPEIKEPMRRALKSLVREPEHTILHELIHYIQHSQTTAWTRIGDKTALVKQQMFNKSNLLNKVMKEGIAEFLKDVIHGQHNRIIAERDDWVRQNNAEQALWQEFSTAIADGDVDRNVVRNWMYNFNPKDRPSDMGYWMGHKIAQSYWNNAPDKKQAFRDLIYARTSADFKTILEKSGYQGDSLGG